MKRRLKVGPCDACRQKSALLLVGYSQYPMCSHIECDCRETQFVCGPCAVKRFELDPWAEIHELVRGDLEPG